LIYQSNCIL